MPCNPEAFGSKIGSRAELTDETRALVQLLRRALDDDPFPHAPRLDPLKAILEKLEPPAASARTLAAAQIRDDPAPRDQSARAVTMNGTGIARAPLI
jgi:hypothetical protein